MARLVEATEEELAAAPGLRRLLGWLDEEVFDGDVLRETRRELEREEALERAERKRLLEWLFVREAAEALLEDAENARGGEAAALEDMGRMLAVGDAAACLGLPDEAEEAPRGARTLMGLQPNGLARACLGPGAAEMRRRTAATAAPLVDRELRRRLDDADAFWGGGDASEPLADRVAAEEERARKARERAARLGDELDVRTAHTARTLRDSLGVLCGLAEGEALGRQREEDAETRDWLRERCATVHRKLAVFKYQLMADTYTPEAARALRRVRRHVDREAAEAEAELRDATDRARGYDRAGAGFERLVAEYADLQRKIDNKRWTLQQMNGEI